MLENDLFLRAARRERTERTPVWLMRQAGRFDPRYREIRQRAGLTLEQMFRTPDLAAEISLLPKRFGVDAIIFFQDILTPLDPMGAKFVFRPGPVIESPIRTADDVARLKPFDPSDKLDFVPRTLKLVQDALAGDLPLLGFAGAPLTLAFFLIEGKSPSPNPAHAQAMMRSAPNLFGRLLDRLTDMTVDYLSLQIDAGVDAVQLFESCADLVSPEEYRRFAHACQVKIFAELDRRAVTILFAKDQPAVDLMADSGADVLSISSRVDLAEAKRQCGDRVALQGNVDSQLLATGSAEQIDDAVRRCIEAGESQGHILNLGHGVLKDTPVDNVQRMIDATRRARPAGPYAQTVAEQEP